MIRLKTIYSTPAFIDENMTIDLTVSQLAQLGVDESVIGEWNDFLETLGFSSPDDVTFVPGFDINDPSTYGDFGFDLGNSSTWLDVIDWSGLEG